MWIVPKMQPNVKIWLMNLQLNSYLHEKNLTFPLKVYWEMPYLILHKYGYYLQERVNICFSQNVHKDSNNIQCLIPKELFTLSKCM